MFEKLNQISDRVFNRYVTVEKNIKAASNSFYDSYLDMVEELLKFLAISDNIELTARMTCGDILHNLEIKAFLSDDLLVDEYTYCKLCDYTLKINAHKHKMEKNIQKQIVLMWQEFIVGEPEYEKIYCLDKIIVTGHTPTGLIDKDYSGRIYKNNNHIAIDCGAVFDKPLGCIRLDDLEEFYVE